MEQREYIQIIKPLAGQTPLADLTGACLKITCNRCGHTSIISGETLLETCPPETQIYRIARRLRCGPCGALGDAQWQVVGAVAELPF